MHTLEDGHIRKKNSALKSKMADSSYVHGRTNGQWRIRF